MVLKICPYCKKKHNLLYPCFPLDRFRKYKPYRIEDQWIEEQEKVKKVYNE